MSRQMSSETREKLQKRRRRKPIKDMLQNVADKHPQDIQAVTSTKNCFLVKMPHDYPNAYVVATQIAEGLNQIDQDLPDYQVKTKYSQHAKAVKIDFQPFNED